jgi:hypothetical protein
MNNLVLWLNRSGAIHKKDSPGLCPTTRERRVVYKIPPLMRLFHPSKNLKKRENTRRVALKDCS